MLFALDYGWTWTVSINLVFILSTCMYRNMKPYSVYLCLHLHLFLILINGLEVFLQSLYVYTYELYADTSNPSINIRNRCICVGIGKRYMDSYSSLSLYIYIYIWPRTWLYLKMRSAQWDIMVNLVIHWPIGMSSNSITSLHRSGFAGRKWLAIQFESHKVPHHYLMCHLSYV